MGNKWDTEHAKELPLEKIAKIIYLSMDGKSRRIIAKESEVSEFSVQKYKKLILEQN